MASMAPALTEAASKAKLSKDLTSNPSPVSRIAITTTSADLQQERVAKSPPSLEGLDKTVPVVSFPKELLSSGVIETKGSPSDAGSRLQYLNLTLSLEELSGVASLTRTASCASQHHCSNPAMNSPNARVPQTTTTVSAAKGAHVPASAQPAVMNGIDGGTHHVPSGGGGDTNRSVGGKPSKHPATCSGAAKNSSTSKSSGPILSFDHAIQSKARVCHTGSANAVGSAKTVSSSVKVRVMANTEAIPEMLRRQRKIEMRARRLSGRLRRLQSRQAVAHIKHQLSGLVEHQHKNLQTMAKSMKSPNPSTSVDLKTELLQSEDVKSLSTAALVTLVRKLQSSQALSLRQRLAHQQAVSEGGSSVLRLDEDLCLEMNRVSGTLQMNLHHLETALDSDATESSSGGESCDEDFDLDYEKPPRSSL